MINFTESSAFEVENLLANMFKGGYPVVLSSGRSAIFIASKLFWKNDIIHVFPYASQCVVIALQRAGFAVATKTDFSSDISIDQWGILDENCKENIFIEDSSDTFLRPDSQVLELKADFEIWSLPKIIGSRFGAVLWCRDEKSAFKIKQYRDESSCGSKYIKKIFRIVRNINKLTYQIWEDYEFLSVGLTNYEYGTILKNIMCWDSIYRNRENQYQNSIKRLELLSPNYFKESTERPLVRIPVIIYTKNITSLGKLELTIHSETLHRVTYRNRPEMVRIYNYLRNS